MSLTATASPQTREVIIGDLSMHNCTFVIEDANRVNIRYSLLQCTDTIEDTFMWLVDQLKDNGINTPRVIVFCQTKKQCCLLYSFFKKELGDNAYCLTAENTMKDDRTCLFGMYHLSTRENQKLSAERSFQDPKGVMRVLFATSSFGTGIDVKECYTCIHYGCPVSAEEYLQQSGRIGRDGTPSHSLILKTKWNSVKLDEHMSVYVKNTTTCRREYLLKVICNPYSSVLIQHACCDLCAENCKCKCTCADEPCNCDEACQRSQDVFISYAERKIREKSVVKIGVKPVLHKVAEIDREHFEQHLLQFRESLLTEEERLQLPLQQDIITGFSYDLIQLLCDNMEFITDVQYLLEHFPFFDSSHAEYTYRALLSMDLEPLEKYCPDSDSSSSGGDTGSDFDEPYTKARISDPDSDIE